MAPVEKILENQRAWQELPVDDVSGMKTIALQSLSECAEAIASLSENLRKFGYVWVSSEHIPENELERNIQQIEAKTGLSVPKILAEFWRIIGEYHSSIWRPMGTYILGQT
jgi:hypothetical protein